MGILGLQYHVSSPDRHVSAGIRTPAACTAGGHSAKKLPRHLIATYSELDQGSLHPLEKFLKQTCPGRGLVLRPPVPQAGTLAKSYRDCLMLPIRNVYSLQFRNSLIHELGNYKMQFLFRARIYLRVGHGTFYCLNILFLLQVHEM
jgi:hypothetical protein